jgi:hypothetical protein
MRKERQDRFSLIIQLRNKKTRNDPAVTKCYAKNPYFAPVKRRKVEVNFEGGEVTSDGGILLLREIDIRLGLTKQLDKALPDPRNPDLIIHRQLTLLRQRIYGLAAGYEDLNDHSTLRQDTVFQTSTGQDDVLASAPTLCRLENRASHTAALRMHEVLIDQFIASHAQPPRRLVLDFDATDDPVHGEQIGRHFSAYYDNYCFLPLYVFCGKQLLVSYLRPASRGAAFNAGAVLKLLVDKLRQAWPKVQIIFRADSGFAIPRILYWCERHHVDYVVGMAKNSVLLRKSQELRALAETCFQLEGKKQVLFSAFRYAAKSWPEERRMIVKAEHSDKGSNPRFLVTSLAHAPQYLYQKIYCARGDMENRIKEQQFLFSDRTSCHDWWPNQFRLLLSGMAYTLMEALRRLALQGTELANAQVDTLRLKLIKIGGVVIRNTRRVKIMLSSAYPYQSLFQHATATLNSG